MTAIMMASMGSAAVTAPTMETTVTVANALWFSDGTDDDYYVYGYNDALADPLGTPTIGSMGTTTYDDGSATTRTISFILYSDNTFGLDPSDEDSIWFGLVGTSIPNTDTTFRIIEYNGVPYTRADADVYNASFGGVVTYWQWQNVSPNGPQSGVVSFKVFL